MKKGYLIVIIIAFVLTLVFVIGFRVLDTSKSLTQTADLEPQTNSEGPVEITVAPKNLSDKGWFFEITLNTHFEELTADLTKSVILFDDKGNEHLSLDWQGDPPGGHHRKDILQFAPISPSPRSITLKIFQIGGIEERNFTWQLK